MILYYFQKNTNNAKIIKFINSQKKINVINNIFVTKISFQM